VRVLFVHNRYLYYGGEDSVVEAEIALLRENGLEVDILVVKNPTGKLSQFFYLLVEFFNIISFFKMLLVIKRKSPDVIHVHNWHYVLSPSIFWAAKLAKVDIFYTIHNYRLLCPSGTLFFDGKLFLDGVHQKFPWAAVRNRVYQNSSIASFFLSFTLYFNQLINTWAIPKKFIFLNSFMAEYMSKSKLQLRVDQIFIKPNFVEVMNVSPDSPTARSGFVFVGRLSEEKGISLILEVFSKLSYVITIIGDGPLNSIVMDYANRYDNIKFLGFLDKKEIIVQLSKAEALIFASIWYEGMPITILEAFSCGTPVFASDIGSLKSIIRNNVNGLFFNPNDGNSLMNLIEMWKSLSLGEQTSMFRSTYKIFNDEYTPEKNFEIFRLLYGLEDGK